MSTYDERTKRYDEDLVFRSLANIITDVDPWAQRQLQATEAILAAGWRPPAEKGDHEIVWYLDGDTVRGDAVCNLGPGADCRVMCPHGCESWTGFSRDEKGPYHLFYDHEIDGDGRHDMVPMTGNECNVTLFLNEDYGYIADLHGSRDRFEVGRVAIAPQWEGDHYTYKVAGGESRA